MRYYYHGIPLVTYCRSNPQVSYWTIKDMIRRVLVENPSANIEATIQSYIDKEHKGIYDYYYQDIPLVEYCEKHRLNYKNIIAYISRNKIRENNPTLTDEQMIEMVMSEYSEAKPLYYYNGVTLAQYCKENSLNASSIRTAIQRKKQKSSLPLQEIINICVETYQKFSIKYYYEGIPLAHYCQQNGLDYKFIYNKYLKEYAGSNIAVDNAINLIIEHYRLNPPIKNKYFVGDLTLTKFCDKNSYSYAAIARRIKGFENKDGFEDQEKRIEASISSYEKKFYFKQLNKIFSRLKENEHNVEAIKNICNFLRISFDNVTNLVNMNFSYRQAVNIIWYFGNKPDDSCLRVISDKRLDEVFQKIDEVKNVTDIDSLDFYDLIGLYKSELYDTRSLIILKQRKYLSKIIYSVCTIYGIRVTKSDFEDFESELKFCLIQLIQRTNSNIYGQIIKYKNVALRNYFITYLTKQYQKNKCYISLDSPRFKKVNDDSEAKAPLYYIADRDIDSSTDNEDFSETMKLVLAGLDENDLSFVMLKFQDELSNEEIARYHSLPLEAIEQQEIRVLGYFREHQEIAKMRVRTS